MNDKTQKCNGTCEVCDCQNTASKRKLKNEKQRTFFANLALNTILNNLAPSR